MSDLVEQVARAIAAHKRRLPPDHPEIDRVWSSYCGQVRAALSVLEPRIEALEAENFKLAAGACTVEGGLIGDDHGHFDCSLKARIEALEREQSWQPIETAPKDGTRVIVYSTTDTPHYADQDYVATVLQGEHVEEVQVARWCEEFEEWELQFIGAPLFWRPLPPPPTGERG
jgi:hypothetical protein